MSLQRTGFRVHSFTDPLEAINHIAKDGCKDCELLVPDIRMLGMDGFELVRRVKMLRPEMNVVMMMAFEVNKREFEQVFPSTPVENVLSKPFVPHLLA